MNADVRAIHFSSAGQPPLQLEGRLHLPTGKGPFPAAVVAHPHPLWGGSMQINLLGRIARTLTAHGCVALRFNFRGVGASQGHYDEGRGETDDLTGALDWLAAQDEVNVQYLSIVGYSFGAWVGGRVAARDDRVCAYAGVALPTSAPYHVDLSRFTRPKCFITGARDTLSAPELLRQYVGALPEPKILHVIPGADHMLLDYEQEVTDYISDCLLASLL